MENCRMLSCNRKTIGGDYKGETAVTSVPSIILLNFPPLDILVPLCTYKKQENPNKINMGS